MMLLIVFSTYSELESIKNQTCKSFKLAQFTDATLNIHEKKEASSISIQSSALEMEEWM